MFRRLPAAVAGIALAAPIVAAPVGPLAITTRTMVEQRRAAPDGTTRIVLAKPDRVGPGDRIVVVVGYRNTGAQPLGDVVLSNPLPRSIAYAGAHAGSPEPETSVDGHDFAPLADLRVSGGTRAATKPATRADVVAVRWRLSRPLAPGAAGELSFDAVVR